MASLKNKQPFSKKEALNYITAFCSREERCIADIRTKLIDFSLADFEIDDVVQFLISEKYIDEERYSAAFVNDKFRFNKWGKLKIVFALKNKKISGNIINSAISQIPNDLYMRQLENELSKKMKSLPQIPIYELKGKLYRFAASRGFENEIIQETLNSIFNE